MDLFEAIHSQRAMRRLKTDPIPDDLIWKLLDAAIRAPSGGNQQPWNFIVLRDLDARTKIAKWYLDSWIDDYGQIQDAGRDNLALARVFASADHLANHLAEVPVLIIGTIRNTGSAGVLSGASIYPAIQNLMLAARALGLGTTLTTRFRSREAEIKQLLGIPMEVNIMALVPVGWPKGKFGAGPRLPAAEVTYWDKWGSTRQRSTPR